MAESGGYMATAGWSRRLLIANTCRQRFAAATQRQSTAACARE
jgi:hypothetical protein